MGNCQETSGALNAKEVTIYNDATSCHKGSIQESTAVQPNTQVHGYSPQMSRSSNWPISVKGLSRGTTLSHNDIKEENYTFERSPKPQTHIKKLKTVPMYQTVSTITVLEFEDGSTYTGMVDAATLKPCGRGVFKHACGDIYEGSFFKGMANGQGTYKHSDGTIYVGNMSDDVKTGYGEETYPNGHVYKGYFYNGNKRGRGKYHWSPEHHYAGEIVNNQKSGFGKLVSRSGDIYSGNWTKDVLEGKGKVVHSNGDIYEGTFFNSMMHGQGKLTTSEFTYEGTFSNNVMEGNTVVSTRTISHKSQTSLQDVVNQN